MKCFNKNSLDVTKIICRLETFISAEKGSENNIKFVAQGGFICSATKFHLFRNKVTFVKQQILFVKQRFKFVPQRFKVVAKHF